MGLFQGLATLLTDFNRVFVRNLANHTRVRSGHNPGFSNDRDAIQIHQICNTASNDAILEADLDSDFIFAFATVFLRVHLLLLCSELFSASS